MFLQQMWGHWIIIKKYNKNLNHYTTNVHKLKKKRKENHIEGSWWDKIFMVTVPFPELIHAVMGSISCAFIQSPILSQSKALVSLNIVPCKIHVLGCWVQVLAATVYDCLAFQDLTHFIFLLFLPYICYFCLPFL